MTRPVDKTWWVLSRFVPRQIECVWFFFKAHVKGHQTFLTNLDIGDQWMRTFLTCSHRMNENELQANQHQFYWIPRQSVNVSWYIYSDYTYQYFMGAYLSLCTYVNPVWNYHNKNNIVRYNWTFLAFWHDALRASKCFFLSTQLKRLQNTARARRIYSFFICNQCSKLKDWRSVQILIHKENKNRNIEVVICQVADTLEIGSDWHVDTFWVILVSPLLFLPT